MARRYMEFLQLYVGKKVPDLSAGPTIASGIGAAIFGVGTFGPFPNRFAGMTYDAALAAFEAEKPVRILFEEGGNAAYAPGTPEAFADYIRREIPKWRRVIETAKIAVE